MGSLTIPQIMTLCQLLVPHNSSNIALFYSYPQRAYSLTVIGLTSRIL